MTAIPVSPGHAYILLGRELDNGQRFYNTVAGFYPDHNEKAAYVKEFYSTKGVVTQTLDDAKSEITFTIYITPNQEQKVSSIIKSYDTKDYSLITRNCVSLSKDVANAIGLTVPSGALSGMIPQAFIKSLMEQNKNRAPVPGAPPGSVSTTGPNAPQPPPNRAIDAAQWTIDNTRPTAPIVPPVIAPTGMPQPPDIIPPPPPTPPQLPPPTPLPIPPVLMPPPN
ncbi:hypothetical protein ACFFTN_21105 [Aminobacter aganoensis]|uniref:Uncharacterized protein n=1 Tax=Aminobacter aganoensis TaxID=83264 RepID=A0A7X0FC08_9HYPH|nr:hypothetical protein [Aminobacter aganoensis]MBB6356931.1 hypothetical protein [Aminobacter aganoensis]